MNIQKILPLYYRLSRDQTAAAGQTVPRIRSSYVFADILSAGTAAKSLPVAPLDLGEKKSATVDVRRPPVPLSGGFEVKIAEESRAPTTAEHALRYKSFSRISLLEARQTLEREIRLAKKLRRPCPLRTPEGRCGKVFIRCGDRCQFSLRETPGEQGRPHMCRYDPARRGNRVIIVDRDDRIREFCRHTLALFFGVNDADVATVDSAAMALSVISRSKMDGNGFGLAIIDAGLADRSASSLVNELYGRNYDISVILTKDASTSQPADVDVHPGDAFTGIVLVKPFHSETLAAACRKLSFGKNLPAAPLPEPA